MPQSYIAVNFFGQVFHPDNFNVNTINTMNKIYSFPLIKKYSKISFVPFKQGIEVSEDKFLSYLEQLEYQLSSLNNTFDIQHNFDYFLADNILDKYYEAGVDTNIFWEDEEEGGSIKLIVYASYFDKKGLAYTATEKTLAEYTIPQEVYSKFNAYPVI